VDEDSRTRLTGRLAISLPYPMRDDIRHLTTSLYKFITVMSAFYHARQHPGY